MASDAPQSHFDHESVDMYRMKLHRLHEDIYVYIMCFLWVDCIHPALPLAFAFHFWCLQNVCRHCSNLMGRLLVIV